MLIESFHSIKYIDINFSKKFFARWLYFLFTKILIFRIRAQCIWEMSQNIWHCERMNTWSGLECLKLRCQYWSWCEMMVDIYDDSKLQKCKILSAMVELECNLDFVVYLKRFIKRCNFAATINKLNDN